MRNYFITINIVLLLTLAADACPFCAAVTQTFAERIETMEVALFARLVKPGDLTRYDPETGDVLRAEFEVLRIIKGEPTIAVGDVVKVALFEPPLEGGSYFLTASTEPELVWDDPVAVTERTFDYVDLVLQLPAGFERLEFFLGYLEDEEEVLRKDAYSEFAKTPYEGIIAIKDKLDRATLRTWIEAPEVSVAHRKLYLTLLGVCGLPEDANFLEKLILSDDEADTAGLDAMIACYLSLKGKEGLPLIHNNFLANPEATYEDTYSAVMAIRFHGNESDTIPRALLVEALRPVLDRSKIADLVLADLARWEDWSVVDKVKQLFLEAEDQAYFLRVPALNYLRACPLPEAVTALDELVRLQPEHVKKAEDYGLFADFSGPDRSSDADPDGVGEARNKSAVPGLAESVRALVEADKRQQSPYPGLGWGLPVAAMVVLSSVYLLGRLD